MIDNSILDANLNDQIDYQAFFHAFGYQPEETIYLRSLDDKKRGNCDRKRNAEITLDHFDRILPSLQKANQDSWSPFFIVNGDSHKDSQVKHARAQFIDFDDYPFDEQIRRLNEFPLEPSIIIKTKKSLHAYWLIDNGDIRLFREVQQRLIQYFGSDPVIQNESRVMRLYGFNHCKTDTPVLVKLVKFDPDLRYNQRQFHENLPLLQRSAVKSPNIQIAEGERVPVGQRHYWIVKKIGEYLSRLKDSATDQSILALVETEFYARCEDTASVDIEDFRKKYLQTIQKLRATREAENNDPEFYSYAMSAWKDANPGEDFDPVTVGWDAVREAGERAKDMDRRIKEGLALRKEQRESAKETAETIPSDDTEGDQASSLAGIFGQEAIVDVISDYDNPIPEKNWIVEGLVTSGECAIISGASKSGKSYLMTSLAVTVASGGLWLNEFQCQKSKVLYINGENQRDDARERFHDVFDAMGISPRDCEQITMLCADGIIKPIQDLKKALIGEITRNQYKVVVLDPLYTIYKGSEIDEQDAKAFVACIKEICRTTGAVIFCVHHHSKGAGIYKNASSRASGSGMLQRAFSTLLDISEVSADDLNLPDHQRGFEFSGQPRQAQNFVKNLIFDYPIWKADTQGLLPQNARNKGQTLAARNKNGNIRKGMEIRRQMPQVLAKAFEDGCKHDKTGDFITVGDVIDAFARLNIDVSDRTVKRYLEDGVDGYQRDQRSGCRQYIRKTDFIEIADDMIPEPMR